MAFWVLAYTKHWITADKLRQAVKTEENPYGQITAEEYKTITGEEYA